jgi:hypothetical protein
MSDAIRLTASGTRGGAGPERPAPQEQERVS